MINKNFIFLKKHIKENLLIYSIVLLCFLIGVSVGAFTVKIVDKHHKEELFYYLRDFFQIFHNNELQGVNILKQSLINNIQLLVLNWILGILIITAPLVLVIVGFKGFTIGFTAGLLIEEFKLWGVLIFTLGIFPQNLIIIPVFIISSVISIIFATIFLKDKLQKTKATKYSKRFLVYSSLYCILFIFVLLAALIEGYISPVFIRLLVSNII
ncbi:MAG: stage II sporulation protein M [Clostridiaceae bacterium]|nr:stage II sporulation protein M [Clostridiaceae bacterium]